MIKILGVVCVVAGCCGIGFALARNYRREVASMQQLIQCLQWMICELNYHMSPLPTLFRGASEVCKGPISQVFSHFAQELEQQISPHVSTCMNVTLESVPNLPEKTAQHLRQLGTSLGMFDLQGQITSMEASLALCRQELEVLKMNRDDRIRNYQTLSLCAGAAIAIILL